MGSFELSVLLCLGFENLKSQVDLFFCSAGSANLGLHCKNSSDLRICVLDSKTWNPRWTKFFVRRRQAPQTSDCTTKFLRLEVSILLLFFSFTFFADNANSGLLKSASKMHKFSFVTEKTKIYLTSWLQSKSQEIVLTSIKTR